jgi:hypothetical protein
MYHDITHALCQASSTVISSSVPDVTLKEFAIVLDFSNLSNVRQPDVEIMFEQSQFLSATVQQH